MKELEGMFYRVQDFSQSYATLNEQFFLEFRVAQATFPKSNGADELHSNLANELRLHSSGANHFTTYALSPAVRHFVNDSCRLLEPLTPVLALKYPNIVPRATESLNSYIEKLIASGQPLPFDAQFVIELYEVWNDYKHRGTNGLHASPWSYDSQEVIKPKLSLPKLKVAPIKLSDIEIDELTRLVTEKILELLDFAL